MQAMMFYFIKYTKKGYNTKINAALCLIYVAVDTYLFLFGYNNVWHIKITSSCMCHVTRKNDCF